MKPQHEQSKSYGIASRRNRRVIVARNMHEARKMPRRDFLTAAGGAVLGASAIGSVLPVGRVLGKG